MSTIQDIYDYSDLHGPLKKYDFLLGFTDRMSLQGQSWACMGFGNYNFPTRSIHKRTPSIQAPKQPG